MESNKNMEKSLVYSVISHIGKKGNFAGGILENKKEQAFHQGKS